MASEARRHQLYEELKHVVSEESADELMSYLPPVGWADVATKADLLLLRSDIDVVRAGLLGEIAELRAEMHQNLASMQRWVVTTNVAVGAVLFAALRLTG